MPFDQTDFEDDTLSRLIRGRDHMRRGDCYWVQGAYAVGVKRCSIGSMLRSGEQGRQFEPYSVTFDAALYLVRAMTFGQKRVSAHKAFGRVPAMRIMSEHRKECCEILIATWNDAEDRTHAEVLALFERAVEIRLGELIVEFFPAPEDETLQALRRGRAFLGRGSAYWCKGAEQYRGAACAMGALDLDNPKCEVSAGDVAVALDAALLPAERDRSHAYYASRGGFRCCLSMWDEFPGCRVAQFNDAPATTYEEVLALYDRAIAMRAVLAPVH